MRTFFILVFFGYLATANSARAFRLDSLNSSMSQIPVWNQGPTGLCTAITAADMIDAVRFNNSQKNIAQGDFTSPIDLMISQKYREKSEKAAWLKTACYLVKNSENYELDALFGGDIRQLIEFVKSQGRCSSLRLPKQGHLLSDLEFEMAGIFSHYKASFVKYSALVRECLRTLFSKVFLQK